MTWSSDKPQGKEMAKTRWRATQYLRGRGLDLGCGPEKVLDTKNVLGVDSCKDVDMFGIAMNPDIKADVEALDMFAAGSMDYVFSSHTLEHIHWEKVPSVLREWMRLVKVGGHLVLYLPDEGQYPKCAEPLRGIFVPEPHCNLDHKWNVSYARIVEAMEKTGANWDLVAYEVCSKEDEYSLFFAFRKLK